MLDLGIGHPSAFVAKYVFNLCKPTVGPDYICQIQNNNAFNNRSFTLQGPNTPAAVFIYTLMCQMDGHQRAAKLCGSVSCISTAGAAWAFVWRRM